MSKGMGSLDALEASYPAQLLAYLAEEIDSTVPSEHLTRRARRLLASAEAVATDICGYDSWDDMATYIFAQREEEGI